MTHFLCSCEGDVRGDLLASCSSALRRAASRLLVSWLAWVQAAGVVLWNTGHASAVKWRPCRPDR